MVIQLLGLKMVIIELRLSRRITIHKSIMSAYMFEALLLVRYSAETACNTDFRKCRTIETAYV